MWKKEEAPTQGPLSRPEAIQRSARPTSSHEPATIGRSITIRGDVTGEEDLLIEGRVEGSVHLAQNSVTVGAEGEVKASLVARVVTVEGKVVGDLSAHEQVILRSSADVQGDITAPRVVLEDGARFRGGVDMGDMSGAGRHTAAAASARGPKAPEPDPAPSRAMDASPRRDEGTTDVSTDVGR